MLSRLIARVRNAGASISPGVVGVKPPTQPDAAAESARTAQGARTNPQFLPSSAETEAEQEYKRAMEEMNQKNADLVASMYKQQLTWGERPPVLAEETWLNDTMNPPKPSSSHVIAAPLSLRRGNARGHLKKPRGKLNAEELIKVLMALEAPMQGAHGVDYFATRQDRLASLLARDRGIAFSTPKTSDATPSISPQPTDVATLNSKIEDLIKQYSLSSEHMLRPHEGVIIVQDQGPSAKPSSSSPMGTEVASNSQHHPQQAQPQSPSQQHAEASSANAPSSEPSKDDVARLDFESTHQMSGYGMTERRDTAMSSSRNQSQAQNESGSFQPVAVSLEEATAQLEAENTFLRRERGGTVTDTAPFVSNFHLVATTADPQATTIGSQSDARPDLDPQRILLNVARHLRVPYMYTDSKAPGLAQGPHAVATKDMIPSHVLRPDRPEQEVAVQRLGVASLAAVLTEAKEKEREAEISRANAQRRALAAENARLLELRERQIKHSLVLRGLSEEEAELRAKEQAEQERQPGSVRGAMAGHVEMQSRYDEHLKQQVEGQHPRVPQAVRPPVPQPIVSEPSQPAPAYRPSPAAQNAIAKMRREAAMRKAGVVPEDEQLWGGLPSIPGTKHHELKQQGGLRINNLQE